MPDRESIGQIPEQRGGNSGIPLSMVLYYTTLVPLAEELREVDPGILTPFYVDESVFYGLAWIITQLLKLLF